MNPLRTYRPRQSFKPRNSFPQGKPRSTRGISQRKKQRLSTHNPRSVKQGPAAGQPKTGRRFNRLPNWTDPHSYITKGGRHRLFGEDYNNLRWAAYLRSCKGTDRPFCECGCERFATWGEHMGIAAKGELSHNEHGARKSDELSRVKWTRHECHMKSHNCNGKPIKITKKSLKEKVHAA